MNRSFCAFFAVASLTFATSASAHISLEQGGTHKSRYGDTELKSAPCGRANGTRGTNIYTYEPGATITVTILEQLSHPSYFRVAFQADGDNEFKEPASIKPIDPNRACPDGPGDHCDKVNGDDFYNTTNVLPNMDDLNPHLGVLGSGPKYTWQVTLPDVECTNCTLQIIQVMEDDTLHGPYDPTPGVGTEDLYHQCIDLVLKKGASADGGGASSSSGSSGTSGGSSGTSGGASSSSSGGTSGGASSSSGAGGSSSSGGSGSSGASSGAANAAPGQSSGCAVTTERAAQGASWLSLVAFAGLFVARRRARRGAK